MDPAPTAVPNPVGEWNHTRIVVNNGHVEHWLNDKKVVEYELYSDDWKKKKMAGKWKMFHRMANPGKVISHSRIMEAKPGLKI